MRFRLRSLKRISCLAEERGHHARQAVPGAPADDEGHRPAGRVTATVGFVLARPADTLGVDSFFLQLISGIQEVLAERHLGLLFPVVEDVEAECAVYRRWWAEHRVDGVLVVDPRTDDPRP